MKAKYIFGSILLPALLTLAGCSSELDIAQHGSLGSQQEYYQTDDEVETGIVAVYTEWRAFWTNQNLMLCELSDESSSGGNFVGDALAWRQLNEFDFDTSNSSIQTVYTALYKIIYYCNLVIDSTPGDSAYQKRCVAEAKFFRAYSYYYLAVLWGETVPLVDHLLSTDEYHVGRSAAGEVWALVESDLQEAISVLPSKSGLNDSATNYRVTKEAAKAYLARAYMWLGKNSEAGKLLKEIISSNLYALWDGPFEDLLHVEANGCCEKILEAQCQDYTSDTQGDIQRSNSIYQYFGWANKRWFQCADPSDPAKAAEYSNYGNGYNCFAPRKGLYEAFVEMEGEDGYRLNSSIRTLDQLEEIGIALNPKNEDMWRHDIYFNWKQRMTLDDLIAPPSGPMPPSNQKINYCYMRYAEVLLMAAECFVDSDQSFALECINKVRTRAQLAPLTSVTLDDVKKEKRLELYNEGVRYIDLLRWGDAYETLKDQGKEVFYLSMKTRQAEVSDTESNASRGFKKGKHEVLPIPLKELEVNGIDVGGNMEQTDCWK